MAEPGPTDTLRAAAKVMRATAARMESILAERSLPDDAAIERVALDVEVFVAAMETLERELDRSGEA
jgi:hypothetical protein